MHCSQDFSRDKSCLIMLYFLQDEMDICMIMWLCDNGKSWRSRRACQKGIALGNQQLGTASALPSYLKPAESALCQEEGNEPPRSSKPVSPQNHTSACLSIKIRSVKKFTVSMRWKQTNCLGRRSADARPGGNFSQGPFLYDEKCLRIIHLGRWHEK